MSEGYHGAEDSVSLDALNREDTNEQPRTTGLHVNLKILVSLFLIFVLVVSDVFTNNIISGFGGAVKGRTPTSYGIVLQGIFLVIFYILAMYLIDSKII